jgi:hypothetical protein
VLVELGISWERIVEHEPGIHEDAAGDLASHCLGEGLEEAEYLAKDNFTIHNLSNINSMAIARTISSANYLETGGTEY